VSGQFRTGWRDVDVEDCARVIVLYCLRCFRGDEKLRQFGWDLVTPTEFLADKLASKCFYTLPLGVILIFEHLDQQSSGRGRKSKKRAAGEDTSQDWSRDEKYDGDIFLEGSYKKHLLRHSNK